MSHLQMPKFMVSDFTVPETIKNNEENTF
jgi:hypothetical protein